MQKSKRIQVKKKIHSTVEKTKTGFSAYANEYPVYTTGKTLSKLTKNLVEAFNLFFEDERKFVTANNIVLNIDIQQFFQYYKVINARFLAERISMNPTLLSQYVQGRKKPSEQQTERILEGIHEIGMELSEMNLDRGNDQITTRLFVIKYKMCIAYLFILKP